MQAALLPARAFAPTLPSLLVSFDLWHFAEYATGIFFWKWKIVNVVSDP